MIKNLSQHCVVLPKTCQPVALCSDLKVNRRTKLIQLDYANLHYREVAYSGD